jgi:hypothetical protein
MMKIFFTALFIFGLQAAFATSPAKKAIADTVFFRNGDIYKVRIVDITTEKVFYKRFNDEEERFFWIQDIRSVLLDDGKIISFDNQPNINQHLPPIIQQKTNRSPRERYEMGYLDSKLYYQQRDIFWLGFGLVILGFIGLFATAIISLIPPNTQDLVTRDSRILFGNNSPVFENFKDSNYAKGYLRGARKRKTGRIWTGFLAGLGALIGFLLVLIASIG